MQFRLALLCFAICLAVLAQGQQDILAIPFALQSIHIDGWGDDWDTDPLNFTVKNTYTSDSNQVQLRLAWNEQFLFGRAQISDRQLVKLRSGTNNPTLNLGDAIEVYLDPFADSHDRMDLNDYQFIMDVGGDYAIFKGDKNFIREEYQTPKDTGLATIAFDFLAQKFGTVNDESNVDGGWAIEFALPWAALGVHAHRGTVFRLDFCLDDMDDEVNLEDYTENDVIEPYSFASWQGDTTFGFPNRWRACCLVGEPDTLTKAWRFSGKRGFLLLALAVLLALGIALRQYLLIRRLRKLPRQSEVELTPAGNWAIEQPIAERPQLPSAELFDCMRALVLERMHDDLRPEDLASAANMSLRQLQRTFREELDTSPHHFIIMLKMERASAMLREGKSNVSEVAWALGFTDPAYFSKVFKKYFGSSPKEFQSQA
ncbi:MAG: helix-turn-helix domain-containing protein [Saprospiraceae bacterium]|nr:helix-turn-helix domain-containing protein [Saprospiraceae bacterium]